jgi:hypothetical protein
MEKTIKKEKKALLLKVDSELYSKFNYLCQEEGFNVTLVLNQMIKKAVNNQELW